jgi:probable rRNA maturation factor
MNIDISMEVDSWNSIPNLVELSETALRAAAQQSGLLLLHEAEVSLVFTDNATFQELNRGWRDQDKPTNVLSFPAVEPEKVATSLLLGDIILAYETVKAESFDRQISMPNHIQHLVVHGFLHLLGFDHQTDAEAEKMEGLEVMILGQLGVANPYSNEPTELA